MKLWRKLGQAMDSALKAVQRLYRRVIQPVFGDRPDVAIDKGELITKYVEEAYKIGARVGWKLTAEDAQRAAEMPRVILETVVERAKRQADDMQERIAERVRTTEVTGPQVAAQTRTAGEAGAWSGMDTGANEAAKTYQLRLKTWVRAYARQEKRPGHVALEGVTIPFDDLFELPSGARVWQPRDWARLPDPAEWVNCGHALRYSSREVTE